MKFRLVEENELEYRARKHEKKQKGMSPFVKLNAGDVEHNQSVFNHMNTPAGDAPNAGEGMGEECEV